MGRQTILKRLIKSQIRPTWNYPLKDIPSLSDCDEIEKEDLTRLIKTKKFNPKKYSQSHNLDIDKKIFNVGAYKVEATRANTQNIDGGGRSFTEHSRLVTSERWEVKVTDSQGNLVSNRVIMIPKSGDTEALLYSQILNIL